MGVSTWEGRNAWARVRGRGRVRANAEKDGAGSVLMGVGGGSGAWRRYFWKHGRQADILR